jgi:hypothetical protein
VGRSEKWDEERRFMKLIIFTFLAGCLLSFSAFGQGETARKIHEFGEQISIKADVQNIRDSELTENPKAKLYIINYGTPISVEKRLKQLNKAFDFVFYTDDYKSRIEVAPTILNPFLMTEFWIVPEGAENPKPTIYAEKVEEIGYITNGDLKSRFQSLTEKLDSNVLYICNFGSKKEKLKRLKWISNLIKFLSFEKYGIQIIDGGTSKTLKTEFWLMPKK